jgi:hypothetical protein
MDATGDATARDEAASACKEAVDSNAGLNQPRAFRLRDRRAVAGP